MLVAVLVFAAALAAPLSAAVTAPAAAPAAAAAPLELAPGVRYDPAIPTSRQVLGHDFGEAISTPEEIVRYLEALHAAAPERTRLVEYARTWEGRPLVVMIVGSPERIAHLDEIERGLRRLGDPRGLAAGEAEKLVAELPVAVWLLHAVHGNEISSSDAALAEAYHLLAAQDDATAQAISREALALIDPLENPDGRARFLAANGAGRAAEPDAEPLAAEHDEPWPRGRSNHYLFDMNRDWFALSQPETRGRIVIGLRFLPQVAVDEHEMGGDETYYFAPPATPENPYITSSQHDWLLAFGRDLAARFDARGFAYFNREIFDSFYPGYGESWPMFQGAIGMTFEQASPRGLVYRREDGDLLTYRQAVVHHFTSALATLATAAAHREKLLRDFLAYRQSASAEGERGPVRAYLLPPGGDPPRVERLARLLVAQGIEVRRTEQPLTIDEPASAGKPRAGGRRALPAGTFVVPAAQPAGRLLRNLFEPSIPMDERFLREQDRRRHKRLPEQFYDLTGWSLPLAWDVEVVTTDRPPAVTTAAFAGATDPRSVTTADPLAPAERGDAALPAARVGYLVPWGVGAAAAVVEALQEELRASVADAPLTVGGVRYGVGTAFFRTATNPPDLSSRLGRILARHDATAVALDSGWVEEGISLGSSDMRPLTAPRVVLAWDRPTQSTSAGWARYVLERRYGQPVTAVRTDSFDELDLARWDVVVLPAGDYGRVLGEDGARRLADWVRAGGTLVTLGEASRWATREKVGLLATTTELRGGKPDVEEKDKDKDKPAPAKAPDEPFDLEKAILPDREPPENVPGTLMRVELDPDHWLAAGSDGEIQAVVESQRVFTPIKLDRGVNVGLYAPAARLVASGLAWPEAQEQLGQKAFLIDQPLGAGHVIAFAEDPNYRAFAEATELLFVNAVLFGPAH